MKLLPSILILACATLLSVELQSWQSAHADVVYCANCGTEYTQLFNKLEMVKQLATNMQQLQAQIDQYKNMISNSTGFSTQVWGKAVNDIASLNSLIQRSKALAFSAGNLDSQFSQRYSGYQSYRSNHLNDANWQNKYKQWSQETSDNALYTLKAANLQASQMNDENALRQRLQAMSQTAEGRMQALQIGNMLADQNMEQLQKLRQLMMLQLQMQANFYQVQQDKEDAMQARREQFFNRASVPTSDGRKF